MRKKLISIWQRSALKLTATTGMLTIPLWSQPSSPAVIAGTATVAENGNLVTVTTTEMKTIIDWKEFSIGEEEATYFNQPDPMAVTLIRVTSTQGSHISGNLTSNGSLYLINSNEIIVGQQGVIDTYGLIASTLDISNDDFLAGGTILFSGASKKTIENEGKIKGRGAGIVLLGYSLVNRGDAIALVGRGQLGSGESIWLNTHTCEITIDQTTSSVRGGIGIDNSGNIRAAQIDLRADGLLYDLAIQQSGFLYAVASLGMKGAVHLEAEGGSIVLSDNASILSQGDQGSGGSIQVLGKTIDLLNRAELVTENDLGGGDIFVGGGMGGKDNTIINSDMTTVGADVLIRAGARLQGNSGNVSIYGTSLADFQGTIRATGGAIEGDGGIVEISQNPIFGGTVDTRAFNGREGVLVLGPRDLVIKTVLQAVGLGSIMTATPIKSKSKKESPTLTLKTDNKIIVNNPLNLNLKFIPPILRSFPLSSLSFYFENSCQREKNHADS